MGAKVELLHGPLSHFGIAGDVHLTNYGQNREILEWPTSWSHLPICNKEGDRSLRQARHEGFRIKDQLVALGMTDAKHGILFGQKDKHRTIAVLSFKDIEAYQKCMEVIEGGDWDEEVVKVMRQENYVIDAEIVL